MPRDGSGNYSLPVGNPVVSNTVIASSWANDTMSDIATQLNNVLTRDGILGPVNQFKLIDGNVSIPGLAFNSEPGLGLYRINTSILGFAAAGKQTIVSDASTAGAVVTSLYPRSVGQAELRINQDIYGTADTTVLRLYQAPAGAVIQSLAVGAGLAKPIFYTASAHDFTGPTTINGATKVAAPSGTDSVLSIDRITTTTDDSILRFSTSGNARFDLYNTGDESGGGSTLQLNRISNAGVSNAVISFSRSNGDIVTQGLMSVGAGLGAGVTGLSVTRNSQFGGQVGVTATGVAINASGGSITAKTGFNWTSDGPWGLTSASFNTGGAAAREIDGLNFSSIGDNAFVQVFHNPAVNTWFRFSAGTAAFDMYNNGQGQSTGGWIATSDRRVKTDIKIIGNALEKLRTVGGYTYLKQDMKDMSGVAPRKAGYIAQEIQAILPEAVMVGVDEMGTLAVDHNGVIGLLIEAVKELDARTLIH